MLVLITDDVIIGLHRLRRFVIIYLGQDVLLCVGNLAVDYTVDVTSCHNCLHHLLMCTSGENLF